MATVDIYLHGIVPSYRDGRLADRVRVRVPEGAELLETINAPTSLFVPQPDQPGLRRAMSPREAFALAEAGRGGFWVEGVETEAMRRSAGCAS